MVIVLWVTARAGYSANHPTPFAKGIFLNCGNFHLPAGSFSRLVFSQHFSAAGLQGWLLWYLPLCPPLLLPGAVSDSFFGRRVCFRARPAPLCESYYFTQSKHSPPGGAGFFFLCFVMGFW